MAFSEDLASARRISSPSQEEPLINLDLQSLQRYNDLTLEILKNIQEQDKRHQERNRELMSINQSIITALSEMLITPKSLAEPKENPVSPTSHSGMLVDSTLLGSNSPSQVPQSIINLQPQPVSVAIDHDPGTNAYKHFPRRASLFLCLVVFTVINIVWKQFFAPNLFTHKSSFITTSQIHGRSDSTSMSSFLLRPSLTVQSYKPSPEPDPSGNNIQSFSLPVQNFDETDSQLSPAALFHLSPPKPPPDPSHQADNIPRLKCCVLNTREPPDPLSIRYDLSANIPRLKCCNTREPLHLRLTPTPVLTSLRLAPVPPRPPSTALT